ncbi:MAG: sulfotransferase family protein [Alphaproteobacteria bacterium]|nr:sulfotransferase family protein [Alphaproteobacteria bacterium]
MDRRPVFLWATPRSVSTAFERVMKNSAHLDICHEPYTEAYYFGPDRVSDRYGDLPGDRDLEQFSRAATNGRMLMEIASKRVFMKELAFQAERYIDDDLLGSALNLFITRHPRNVYASLVRIKPDFTEEEFGFTALKRVYDRVKGLRQETIVVDGDAFRRAPEPVVERVCAFIRVPFSPDLLHWDDGRIRDWKPEESQSQSKYHATLESSRTVLPPETGRLPPPRPEHREILEFSEKVYSDILHDQGCPRCREPS